MKKLTILCFCILVAFSCNIDDDAPTNNTPPPEPLFNAKVLRVGIDCGDAFLIQFNENAQNIPVNSGGNIFHEINLPQEYRIDDLEIYVIFREPVVNEIFACSDIGPYYPLIYIESVIDCFVGQDCM